MEQQVNGKALQFSRSVLSGDDHHWSTGANWNQGTPPTHLDNAYINTGRAVLDRPASDETVNRTSPSGTTHTGGWIQGLHVGSAGNTGQLVIKDGGGILLHKRTDREFYIGTGGGTGTLTQTGGVVQAAFPPLKLGVGSGSRGTYNLRGGLFDQARSSIGGIGTDGGTGLFHMTGGAFVVSADVPIGTGGTFRVGGSDPVEIRAGGAWKQEGMLEANIDSGGVCRIDVGGDVRFGSNAELDPGFVDEPVSGIWKLMTWEGDLTNNGLSLAPGVDTDTWHVNINKRAGTLVIMAVPAEAAQDEDLESILLGFLNDRERTIQVRLNAIDALASIQNPSRDIPSHFLDLLTRREVPQPIRLKALRTLLQSDVATRDLAPVLLDILKDTDDETDVRIAALDALQQAGVAEDRVWPVLVDLLQDTDDAGAVRRAVAEDLGTFDVASGEIVPDVLDVLRNNDAGETVRLDLYNVLLGIDAAREDIASALLDALKQAKQPEAVPTVTLLTLSFYQDALGRRFAEPVKFSRALFQVLMGTDDGNPAHRTAISQLTEFEDQVPNVKLAPALLKCLRDAENTDGVRRAILEGTGALEITADHIDENADNPYPETREGIDAYKTHVLDAYHEEICAYPETVTEISSLSALSEYAGKSGVHVRMKPGIYEVTVDNYEQLLDKKTNALFSFSGSHSYFDLRGVEIKTDTIIPASDVDVGGNNLIIQGLTVTNVGNYSQPEGRNSFGVSGNNNLIQGVRTYTRGSHQYGYIDGRTPYANNWGINGRKKRSFGAGGRNNSYVNLQIYQRANGHALSWSADGDISKIFIDCHVEGQVRFTSDVLERTEGGFFTDRSELPAELDLSEHLQPGRLIQLSEDAFRSYGSPKGELKVLGCTVTDIRNAFVRGDWDHVFISNTTVLRNWGAYLIPGDTVKIVNCKVDLLFGAFLIRYGDSSGDQIDLTIVPADPDAIPEHLREGWIAKINGRDHDIVLKKEGELRIKQTPPIRVMGQNIDLRNETGLPIVLTDTSTKCRLVTNGSVTDNGTKNEIRRLGD